VRPVVLLGNPSLRLKSKMLSRKELKSKDLKKIVRELFLNMEFHGGLGIAAPQLGISKRLFVTGSKENPRYPDVPPLPYKAYVNPQIQPLTDEIQGFWEGCLSLPGLLGFIERPNKIHISYFNENGKAKEETVGGFYATVLQHEYDHLEGILFIDKIKSKEYLGFREEIDKLRRDPVLD